MRQQMDEDGVGGNLGDKRVGSGDQPKQRPGGWLILQDNLSIQMIVLFSRI